MTDLVSTGTPPTHALLERRGDRHAPLAAVVTLAMGATLLDASALDVSPTGMRLAAASEVTPGKAVALVFFLDGELVSARGVVRWCAPTSRDRYVFGVRFETIEDDGLSLLASYCRSHVC